MQPPGELTAVRVRCRTSSARPAMCSSCHELRLTVRAPPSTPFRDYTQLRSLPSNWLLTFVPLQGTSTACEAEVAYGRKQDADTVVLLLSADQFQHIALGSEQSVWSGLWRARGPAPGGAGAVDIIAGAGAVAAAAGHADQGRGRANRAARHREPAHGRPAVGPGAAAEVKKDPRSPMSPAILFRSVCS